MLKLARDEKIILTIAAIAATGFFLFTNPLVARMIFKGIALVVLIALGSAIGRLIYRDYLH